MPDLLVEQLINLRHAKKLTQRELGELSGVPYVTIARMESGSIRPNMATVDRLLDVLQGETKIVERRPGFKCRLKIKNGVIKLPTAVLKRLGIRKGKESRIQLRNRPQGVSLERTLSFKLETILRNSG